jgi:hypothetical protein
MNDTCNTAIRRTYDVHPGSCRGVCMYVAGILCHCERCGSIVLDPSANGRFQCDVIKKHFSRALVTAIYSLKLLKLCHRPDDGGSTHL